MNPTRFRQKAPCWGAFFVLLWLPLAAWAGKTVRVDYVPDGDTVILADRTVVRLAGINTPEAGRNGQPWQPLARQARQRLQTLVAGTVRLSTANEARDRHGRTLAYLDTASGQDIQAKLVREGLAWVVAIPPNVERLARLVEAETAARAAKRGVWAQAEYKAIDAAGLTAEHSGFARVQGRISRHWSNRQGDKLFLLDGALLLRVSGHHWPLFGGTPQNWQDRQIEVRGWISRNHKGQPRIRTEHPFMWGQPLKAEARTGN